MCAPENHYKQPKIHKTSVLQRGKLTRENAKDDRFLRLVNDNLSQLDGVVYVKYRPCEGVTSAFPLHNDRAAIDHGFSSSY